MKENISIKEMLELSQELYKKNKDKWGKAAPESAERWILWLIGEIGEVIDIIKKRGTRKIMKDLELRKVVIEEIADCYMYLTDILNRFKISPKEFSKIYFRKMNFNLKRDYSKRKIHKENQIEKYGKKRGIKFIKRKS